MSVKGAGTLITRVTDPLSELKTTAEILYSQRARADATFSVITDLLERGKYSGRPVFAAYSINASRCARIINIVETYSSEEFEQEHATECIEAIKAVAEVFSPHRFHLSFQSVVGEVLKERHITALRYSGPHFRKQHPLRVITDREIDECMMRIDEGIQEILNQKDFPAWAADPLLRGAKQIHFILKNLKICGQDALSESIMIAMSHVVGFVNFQKAGKIATYSVAMLCTALIGVADIISAPKNIAEGLPFWRSTVDSAIEYVVPLLAPPPRQIAGPKRATETEALRPNDESSDT